MENLCPQCQNQMIETFVKPKIFVQKTKTAPLFRCTADTCENCGFVNLRIQNDELGELKKTKSGAELVNNMFFYIMSMVFLYLFIMYLKKRNIWPF